MSGWVCLRCDWTGGARRLCPICGVPLYRRQPTRQSAEPTTPAEVSEAARSVTHRADARMQSRSRKPSRDRSISPPTPVPLTDARWTVVLIVVGLVAAAGLGDRLLRPTADRTSARVATAGRQGAPVVSAAPTGDVRVEGWQESSVGHGSLRTSVQYIREAAAICEAVTARFRAATAGLGYPVDQSAWNAAAIRYSERSLMKLRALPLPKMKGQRTRFGEYQALLRKQIDTFRRVAAALSAGRAARTEELVAELVELTHLKDVREPGLRSCPVAIDG